MALTPGTRLGPYKIAAQIAVSPNRKRRVDTEPHSLMCLTNGGYDSSVPPHALKDYQRIRALTSNDATRPTLERQLRLLAARQFGA